MSAKNLVDEVELSVDVAGAIVDMCESHDVTSHDGSVYLNLSNDDIIKIVDDAMKQRQDQDELQDSYKLHRMKILHCILQSRYRNLHSLLQNHVTEQTYLGIVKNQILVDVQGDDLLYQIFTCNILQHNIGDEAPFFEFIQRVCSSNSECTLEDGDNCSKKIKPGCGGFG